MHSFSHYYFLYLDTDPTILKWKCLSWCGNQQKSKAMAGRIWHTEQVSYELQIDKEDEVPIIWV